MVGNWYSAYGLRIHSQLPLPAPHSKPADRADVVIRMGKVEGDLSGVPGSRSILRASPEEICCNFEGAGRFCVREGKEVVIEPAEGVHAELLAAWVQGSALSLVLHQRGYLVLHASSVAIGSRAIAFIGESGWGKSTTAAALHARGHRLIADDVVAVGFGDGSPSVIPGFQHLKLLPESVQAIGQDITSLQHAFGDDDKRLLYARERFSPEPVPLAHVFVLGEGQECAIEPLRPQAAIVELIRHAFVARLTEFLRLTNSAASHFNHCTQVIKQAGVSAMRRPKTFDRLPMMIDMIEHHMADISFSGQSL